MDEAFLLQLGNQLTQIVQQQVAKSGFQLELSTAELPALSISNPSPCILPGPQLLHKLALSGANDSAPAIEFLAADGSIRCLTYSSLDRLSSKLAAKILSASAAQVNHAQRFVVPVLLPQSVELYISQLAILKAGGAFCPLNTDAPPDRIEFIIQDVAASVVITRDALATRMPQDEHLAVIKVDGIETNETNDPNFIEPVVHSSPTDLAYVMYTSGSTGRPKGVGVSHLAATQSLLAHNDLIPHFNRFLQFASPTFDVSVFEIFFPFMRGATLIGSEREQMLLDISHVMTEMKVDGAELTPTVAGELLRTRAAAPFLRVLLTIGEMLTKHVVEEFGQSEDSVGILHGMYGPTEAAIHCTAATHFSASSRVNLIGEPFKTVSAFIMSMDFDDKSSLGLQPLPLGEIGELVVGGPQLADGYINRPEENAKAFIESPQYGRLYRTGDKARMLPSGEIECLGRLSSGQVKLRGQRIELGEIEHVICRAQDIRSAVAIVSGGSLVSFVLVSDKGTTDRALRDICRQWLPRYMVPSEFILVNQFPQLPSGKIDRKALEADFIRLRSTSQSVDQQQFRDEIEETIVSCVVDVLGRKLSPEESLTAAGLDSLAAIRLASHLLGAGIPSDVARLLEADCVEGIWQLARDTEKTQTTEASQAGLVKIRQLVADAGASRIESLGLSAQVSEIEPCSHIQQAMILETARDAKAYCNWIELEFQRSKSIDYTAVQNAFVQLFLRNDLLRSGFVEIGLKDHSYARFTRKILNEQLFLKRDTFDYDLPLVAELDLLQPIRIQLRESQKHIRVLVHIHHALYDGWSWQLILQDLHRLLLGEDLPPKSAYNIVTDFFIEHKLSGSTNESSIFWRDQLQGASGANFPKFHGKTDVSASTHVATRVLEVSVSKLNDVSQHLRVSRQTIFQAAYCYILSSYLGFDDVVFGTVFSGRTLPVKGIETVLGPCIRTLPTRMDLGKMQNVTDLLLAIQNMNLKSLEHGNLPLQDIKKASGIEMHLSLFDTALVWQESIWSNDEHRDLFWEVGAAEFLEFALLLEFEPRQDKIFAKATCQGSILPFKQAQILLEQIDHVASIFIDLPALLIDQIGGYLPQATLSISTSEFERQQELPCFISGVEIASINPATGICTIYPNFPSSTSPGNTEMPIKKTFAMVVTDQTATGLLPRGAYGEICFGGDQMANVLPDTKIPDAGRFIENREHGRLFMTGEYGRLLADGSIMLLPSRDQLKLHGQCIDLVEIDRAIISSELVENACSVVWNEPSTNQQQLAAFWVSKEKILDSVQLESLTERLFSEISMRLPFSEIPSLLVSVNEIPMTEAHRRDYAKIFNKLERSTSEDLKIFSRKLGVAEVDDPLTDIESTIARALSAVTAVGLQHIRKHTSFYKLGLDSLSAISLSRRLQNDGCGRLPISTILRYSSVTQLAAVVPSLTNGHKAEQPPAENSMPTLDETFVLAVKDEFDTTDIPVDRIYPCTPLQEAMLASDSDVDSAYFNHLLLRVTTDVETLRAAWSQMLQRHDILRTCFRSTNDKRFAFAQVVLSQAVLPWTEVEISDEVDQHVEERKAEFECQSPVGGNPPYCLTVFLSPAEQSAHLLLSIHHALYDGEGIAQLLNELQLSLAGQKLPEPTQFHRFIDYMVSASSDTSDQYWDRYLSGVTPSLIPTPEQAESSINQSTSQQTNTDLKVPLGSFKQRCKELSVTPLNIFHAAWARLLSLHTDSSDVCFGNVFSCRTVPVEGADQIVGPCFNTLPVRLKFSSHSTNADVLKLSQKHNSDILPHQLSPLRRIQRRVLQGGSRLFDTLVILQTRNNELDPQYWELVRDEGNMGFPLICEVVPDEPNNSIRICLHYQVSHLTREATEKLAQDFVALVEHTTQYPSAQASDRHAIGMDKLQIFETKSSSQVNSIQMSSTQSEPIRAWSYQEEALRDILCQFSGIDTEAVSLNTTIFQLGLDSINAVQISGTFRRLGYKISAGDILEAASIEKIASLLEISEKGNKQDEFDFSSFEDNHLQTVCNQLGLSVQAVQSLRPCTPVQNGMLALFTHSHGDLYFNKMVLKSKVPLDKVLLKEAWSKVAAEHEMLRTGFVQLLDQQYPFAMITYHDGFEIPWHETSKATSNGSVQEQRVLENLHQPPWEVTVDSGEQIDVVHFAALHAIYDAQSLEMIFSDVMAAYEGKAIKKPAAISATLGPILIESQKQIESGQEFWQGLASEVRSSKFPDLHPIRTEKKDLLETSIRCSHPLKTLEGRCRELGVTLQAAAQASWARLLAAYTGERNVVFGTVLSGRSLSAAAQEAVFPCLVTVPSPSRIEGTNRELLGRTLMSNSSLVKNQFAPLAQIQRWLGSDEPLFDTLFVYQKFSSMSKRPAAWIVADEATKIDYPVSIELLPQSTDLEIRISYRSDLVPEEQAMTLLSQYDKLLEQTIFAPESDSNDYMCLGNDLLSITPAKEQKIPTSLSLLHQFVEENAQRIPDKAAFEFATGATADSLQKKTWSYCELDGDGNRVAHFLQDKGVVPGGMIAICFDKCPEASIAILGILKAGCAYLAIDPGAPISRKQFILEDSETKILLCNQARKTELEGLAGIDVQVLDEPGLFEGLSSAPPVLSREIQPSDTCYCLYTSGTTGTPKGCEITHDNAVQAMLAFQRLFSLHWDEDSRWLQFASFHFDVSVLEQYWSWSVGICVTSCPRDLLFEDLPGTIQKLQITHIDLTPSLARLVHPDEVPSLCRGVFITGGEALKQEILDAWGKHGVIYNGYGPTEVTIGCTMLPRMRANDKPSNIGPQFDNVGSYVFRPGTSTPVVRGGLGELCVSGPLVGKGYLNRAELTQERFQELPEYGDRFYRTGDLVRILYDGSFQFLGRIDDQVKLRGQRLEIGEINEVIKQATPELNEVATLVIKHPKQTKDQLVSFITRVDADKSRNVGVCADENHRALLSTIKAACHTHLPGYMVPTHIIPMTRFALSANNKAEINVLKSIYQELSPEDLQKLTSMTVDGSKRTEQEGRIISILAKFIGSTDGAISSWSSIYELGLDSISVISFSRSLREAGFSQAQPSLIMKHPTVAGMALALKISTAPSVSLENLHRNARQHIEAFAHKHSHSVIESIGVVDSDVEQIAPCTPLQEGIIYHFLSSTTPLYCSSFTFELDSQIVLEKLQNAWSQAQDQVQMLRARFSPSSDGYAQAVLKKDVLPWFQTKVDSEEEIEISHKRHLEKWISSLGNLSAQLWEVGVVSSPEKSVMNLNIFHALYDGNSLALLLELVAHIYLDSQMALEHPPGFLDVLHLGPLCKDPSEQAFWKEHLVNRQSRALPKSEDKSNSPILENIRIDSTEHLNRLRNSLNVTEQAVLHACWLLTLYRHYSFVPSLGIIASGRMIDVIGIANVVGPLFNTIPSNFQLHGLKSWSDVAQWCHEYHVATIPFQYTALRDISKWLGKNPDERLFESLFVFQRENSKSDSSTDGLWSPLASEAQHEYPLAFEIVRNGDEYLTATLAAKGHVLSLKAAQQILATFKEILSEFADNPEQQLPYMNGFMDEHEARPNGEEIEKPKECLNSSGNGDESLFQWTPRACTIRNVIATLAGVDAQSIGEDTSIFEVGLDSIDAIKLSTRLSKLSIKLPVSAIMRHRSVKGMVGQLTETVYEEQNGTYPLLGQMERALKEFLDREELVPQGASRILPATPIQEAMMAEMSASEYQHYYNHDILKIEPHVDVTKLQEAWRAVVRAHPILRTSFVEVWDPEISASYAQVVHTEDTFDFQAVQLDGENVDSVIKAQRARASTELAGKPLLTITSAVDGEDRYLVLSIAHALYDGWSINLLHEDVARSYAGEDYARSPPDAILEQILASSGDRALKFWRATLSNCTPVTFPSGQDSTEDSRVVYRAEKSLSISFEKAESFCKRNGITMQALLVSCWSLVLATYVKKLDVVFGLVLSGRNVTGSENVMFPTMNTAAMRVILHGARLELLKYVQETLLEMSEHQHFPLRRARPDTRSQQLFDTLFIYQKKPSETSTPELALYKSTGGASDVEYPVCVEVEGVGANLVARVACSGHVLGEKGTLDLLERMGKVLTSIIDEPAQQTVGFEGDRMEICSMFFTVDASSQVVQNSTIRKTVSQQPWTSLESKIRNVLAVVSGVPRDSIEREANIFQLGLDSISAIKVAALLKKQSIKLAVSDMLRAGTVEKMAIAVNNHHTELTSTEVASFLERSLEGIEADSLLQSYGIDLDQVEIVLPATAGQTYFLAMHTLNPSIFYPEFHYLASQLHQDVLDGAWARLAELTPMLRTVFMPADKEPHLPYVQAVLKHVHNPTVWHQNVDELVTPNTKQPFGALPATLHACQTSEGTALALQIHHALYDAISLPSMMDRFAYLCRSISSESRSEPHDLSRFVAFQQIHSPVDFRRQFWQKYLGQISIDSANGKCRGDFGAIQQHYRPGLVSNMSRVEIAAQKQGLGVQSIFLAVYARVHAQILAAAGVDSKEIPRQLVVGLYLANRSHDLEGLSELMAPTVNIVPLRLDDKLSHDQESLFVAARKIQDDINEISMIQHSGVSLVEIARWTGVRISTCVNFLRLPEKESTDAADATDRVEFKPLGRDKLSSLRLSILSRPDQSRTNGDTAASLSPAPPVHVGSTAAMQDVFMPTIDVEAAIRDARLDFGIFAPEARLDHSTAEQMIEKVRQEMGALVETLEIV
ncbi:uncharacterized protein N7443_002982 [Penicillium atrosanguineum]|uniref:uncharacterized protein n=1 Tax=Penicillium atrosanguineum TaxID=1132637 RepID=UPI00239D6F40|nr:uncharacterized protein N7443_002982 [Penicillium atrosanguineum]KAJ5310521.1 hypothetical protein N7443_002982 [Penicillium atrosanguineum]